jgi:hypothetical protein
MRPWYPRFPLIGCVLMLSVVASNALNPERPQSRYRIEPHSTERVQTQFSEPQLALLEKLNRADRAHLDRLPHLVVPTEWGDDELTYSSLPPRYAPAATWPQLIIVHVPGQVFGAYVFGSLVHWGPISSGGRAHPTGPGLFTLNWRSPGRTSTVNSDWFMRWYFNFDNLEGRALHAYALPGYPASHGCIRLLERDARWLYDWGQIWAVDSSGTVVVRAGTPLMIVGKYDFDAPPPWRSASWLAHPVLLPADPGT